MNELNDSIDGRSGDYGRWQAEGHALIIEYSLQVLEELRIQTETGFQKIPHGGIEIGGVLLGKHERGLVRIEEWRMIACEHALGPGFLLSENDTAGLQLLLDVCAESAELDGLEPVGWFHTHNRSGIFLSEEDIAIHDHYFPKPWQVALVLRPAKDQPMRAGFFFREEGSQLRTDAPYVEFPVRPDTTQIMKPPRPSSAKPAMDPGCPKAVHAMVGAVPKEIPTRPLETDPLTGRLPRIVQDPPAINAGGVELLPTTPEGRGGGLRWRVFILVAALGLLTAAVLISRPYWLKRATETVALRLEEVDDQLIIRWDHDTSIVREADSSLLLVIDGGVRRDIKLDRDLTHHGNVTYSRQSADVEVRMTIFQNGALTRHEIARYLGAAPKRTASPPPSDVDEEITLLEEKRVKLRGDLRQEDARTRKLREEARALERKKSTARK